MLRSRPVVALSLLLGVAIGPASRAADHVVAPAAVEARLAENAAERQADLAAVRGVLATPEAARALRTLKADPAQLDARLVALDASELRDLGARARALQADRAAGLDSDVNTLLVVFLLVAIVVLVLGAA